jgi:hypothetical protein
MNRISKFEKWLINEAIVTAHVNKRSIERIYESQDIILPKTLIDRFSEEEIAIIKKNLSELIIDEYSERLDKAAAIEYPKNIATGFPVMEMYLKYANKTYPLSIKVDDKREGNQIFISVISNALTTVKIFPDDMHLLEINRDLKYHIMNRPETGEWLEGGTFKYEPMEEDDIHIFNLNLHSDLNVYREGELQIRKNVVQNSDFYKKNHFYNLGKGRKIKVQSALGENGYIEGIIDRVVNSKKKTFGKAHNMIITDPFVQVDITVDIKGKPAKITKQLKPGDILYLPIGERIDDARKFVRCQIEKKFYVSNMVMKEPISLSVKALNE